jgi:hypothetical protein
VKAHLQNNQSKMDWKSGKRMLWKSKALSSNPSPSNNNNKKNSDIPRKHQALMTMAIMTSGLGQPQSQLPKFLAYSPSSRYYPPTR